MLAYDRVVLIFNPKSTGNAEALATDLRDELAERLPDLPVKLEPTQHAGHARDLAREAAATGSPLVVSVSGDGGYNEVVDGVMQSGNDRAVCAVLPAGNANDHRRATKKRPLIQAIVAGEVTRLDLLRLTVDGADVPTGHAHSYIGLGLTPVVAVELVKGGKGSIKEMITTVRAFAKFRPFEIKLADGTPKHFDSIVFANISEMAKVATLSEPETPDDGMFEVITIEATSKAALLRAAFKAATKGLGPQPSVHDYHFTTIDPMPIQIDGEVAQLPGGASVRVDIAPKALQTIV